MHRPHRPPLTLPQVIPGVWIQKRALREALVARGHPSASFVAARIGNRRLGGYEVLRGRQGNSDYLLLRAATEEAAAGLPPTPDAEALAAAAAAALPQAPQPSDTAAHTAAAAALPPLSNAVAQAATAGAAADELHPARTSARISQRPSERRGSEDDAPQARRKAAAPASHRSAPLQEAATEQAFLLSIIAALQARAPPARVRSLTAAAAASPPAGTHPLLQTLRPPPLTSYRVPFRC
jgi:hypothetical protein